MRILFSYLELYNSLCGLGRRTFDKEHFSSSIKSFGTALGQKQIEELFDQINVNKDDSISYDEFHKWVREQESQGIVEEEIDLSFYVLDQGRVGAISETDVKGVLMGVGLELSEEQLHTLFKHIDTNGNGTVSIDEYREFVASDIRKIAYPYEAILENVERILKSRE